MKTIYLDEILAPISTAISSNGSAYAANFLEIDDRIVNNLLNQSETHIFQILDVLSTMYKTSERAQYIKHLPDTDRLLLRLYLIIADMQYDCRYTTIQYRNTKDLNEKTFLFLKKAYIECREYHQKNEMDLAKNIKAHIDLIQNGF